IVGELIHLGRGQGGHVVTLMGLLVGFFLALGADLWVETAMARTLVDQPVSREIQMDVGEYYFHPNRLVLTAGEPVAIHLTNSGKVEHEIEIIGVGGRMEQIVPVGGETTLYLRPHRPGTGLFICDMPGHLGGGMWGKIEILKPGETTPKEDNSGASST
ncbi:MAG: cupredoxin domain-containing protein, partial [Acidobacteria bacterium]|nr:cupredoxin domain-containing protein [Acidobacteriota bacterium]